MRNEFRLLFACARARHTEANISAIRHMLAGSIDWALFASNAADHGLAGLVGHSLGRIASDMVPEDIQDAFRINLDQTRDANLTSMEGILEILEVLSNAGIAAIPFKGPLLAIQAYEDPGFRLFREWDFLIRDSEKGHAIRILTNHGYSRKGQLTQGQQKILKRISGRETVFHPESGNPISLRTRLTPLTMAMEPDYAGLWARAQVSTVNQQPVVTMSPEDHLQCLALDGAAHMWRNAEGACDVAALMESRPDLDWNAVLERAQSQRRLRSVLLAARLAHTVGANIPPAVAAVRARITRSIQSSVARIVQGWEQAEHRVATRTRGLSVVRLGIHDSFGRWVDHRIRAFFLPTEYHVSRIAFPGRLNNLFVYGASKFVPHRVMLPVSRWFRGALKRAARLANASTRLRSFAKRAGRSGNIGYECYVITLARLPHKYRDFLASNGSTGLPFRRFEGVDGKRLSLTDAIRMGVIRPNVTGYTEGAIGCAVSHLKLWKQAKETRENILIFEDDAYCRSDVQHQLSKLLENIRDWDIILLGYNTGSILDVKMTEDCNFAGFFSNPNPTAAQLTRFQKTPNRVALMRLNSAFGMCAYLVSPRGAEKLIDALPMDNRPVVIPGLQTIKSGRTTFRCITVDMIMNTLYRDIDAYAVVPPLVIPLHDHATSTTHGPGTSIEAIRSQ